MIDECGCNNTRKQMDAGGVGWCKANAKAIAKRVAKNAEKLGYKIGTPQRTAIRFAMLVDRAWLASGPIMTRALHPLRETVIFFGWCYFKIARRKTRNPGRSRRRVTTPAGHGSRKKPKV